MRAVTVRTSDLDQVRSTIGSYFYANSVEMLPPSATLQARLDIVSLGAVTVADIHLGADVRMRFGELGAYHVDVPLSGELRWHQGRQGPWVASPHAAAVFQPVGDTVLDRWYGDCRLLAVKIDRALLVSQLSRMVGAPITSALRIRPQLDTSRGAGASWARLVRLLAIDATNTEAIAGHPLVGDLLQEAVVGGLLVAADHQYRDQMDRELRRQPAPRTIRRVVDAIHAHPDRSWTSATLAEVAGLSQRALQQGFDRHVGASPIRYLRQIRLERVHRDLTAADPSQATVAEIAYRWGFLHLGRFAAAYRKGYGTTPSTTLRS